MMKISKQKIKRVIIISLIVIVAAFASIILYDVIASKSDSGITNNEVEQLLSRCKRKGYNQHYCIIVDYGRFVGSPRFFIYSFDKHQVIAKSIMAHGRGGHSMPWKTDFSNVNGSQCSCLGYFLLRSIMSRATEIRVSELTDWIKVSTIMQDNVASWFIQEKRLTILQNIICRHRSESVRAVSSQTTGLSWFWKGLSRKTSHPFCYGLTNKFAECRLHLFCFSPQTMF